MRPVTLREVAEIIGVSHESARKYSSSDRYPDFPEPIRYDARGHGMMWNAEEIELWHQARPGAGGGQHRADSREAGLKSWKTRRANKTV